MLVDAVAMPVGDAEAVSDKLGPWERVRVGLDSVDAVLLGVGVGVDETTETVSISERVTVVVRAVDMLGVRDELRPSVGDIVPVGLVVFDQRAKETVSEWETERVFVESTDSLWERAEVGEAEADADHERVPFRRVMLSDCVVNREKLSVKLDVSDLERA